MKNNGLKIRIIAIILFLAVISVGYFAVNSLVQNGFFIVPYEPNEPTFDFEAADFEYDIFNDEEYLSLLSRGFISYSTGDSAGNLTVSVSEENYSSYSEAVRLIIDLVKAAQNGDADAYNACFSKAYLNKEGKQPAFTMQQIYDVVITEGNEIAENGYSRTEIELVYKIHKNNGTLRSDMGSDSVRKQYITVTNNNSNKLAKIEQITTPIWEDIENIPPVEYNTANIVIICAVCTIVLTADIIGLAIVFKKTKNISETK